MARKRASMREGPLAELFRATEAAQKQAERQEVEPPPTSDEERRVLDETVEYTPDFAEPEQKVQKAAEPKAEEQPMVEKEPEPSAEPSSEVAVAEPKPVERGRAEEDRVRADVWLEGLPEPPPLFAQPRADSGAYIAVIRVVGVGGAGLNALNRMIDAGIHQVEFLAVNTDIQALQVADAPTKIHIGRDLTEGLGSGADAEVGRQAAEEARDAIRRALRGSDMVFVTAGEGGGTGSGATPIVAEIAKELGALTVAIVTLPFQFEGTQRRRTADEGVKALREACDTVIVVPNERLLEVLDKSTSMLDAFRIADDVLRQGVQGICDLITLPGLINLDFADVRTIMQDAGNALMGIGYSSGENRAVEAVERALRSPLIDSDILGAKGILLSIAGGDDLSLYEVNEAAEIVRQRSGDDTNIIFGATIDERLADQVWVTIVATGFGDRQRRRNGDEMSPPSFLSDL
jgi:cell division protein FtsZ